ncbi:MAG: YceI family protein [Chitinophagaceae bacterium]|nr:YceI family protein [Chitinophagaceae bacterium]
MYKLLFILSLFFLHADNASPIKLSYQIDEKSQLYLLGSTNVNNFKCACTDKFPAAVLEAEVNEQSRNIQFKNTSIRIKTTLLNCKNNVMNRDMHKALKAEKYPYILVELINAQPLHDEKQLQNSKVYKYNVNAVITIAGISKQHLMTVQMVKLSNHLYRLNAAKDLLMSDYEIKPRTPFNIIKIDDLVTIHFDMVVVAAN